VRGLTIFLLGIATCSAGANTVVKVSVQRCSSRVGAVIRVTQSGKAIRGAHLDLYHEIEHGERAAWAGDTNRHGIAKPPALEVGDYRVVADFGKLDATMLLTVSNNGGIRSECNVELTPPETTKILDSFPEQTSSIRVREFRGIVEDELGAVIPHATQILRKPSDEHEVARIHSDERGQFSLPLGHGTYIAVFKVPGFKTQVVGLKVSNDGWDAVRLTMEVAGTATNVPPERWEPPT
jgi:hypothetical protein